MSYELEKVSAPRLAHLVKGEKGYGFNLHGDKNQPGQTISAVDKDSPAEVGGLREGDRVIEVNYQNVEEKTHGEVVQLIKAKSGETSLLVCDKDTLAYLKANNRQCTSDMANFSSVIPAELPEQSHSLPNGNATTEVVHEKIEESAPAAVEESAPPPPESESVTKEVEEHAPTDTTPEEVQQLNNVLDEQEKPEEHVETPVQHVEEAARHVEESSQVETSASQVETVPSQVEEPPKPQEQQIEPEPVVKPDDDKGVSRKKEDALPKKKSVKVTGEGWRSKVDMINAL